MEPPLLLLTYRGLLRFFSLPRLTTLKKQQGRNLKYQSVPNSYVSVGNVPFFYLAILASCFKIVLANDLMHRNNCLEHQIELLQNPTATRKLRFFNIYLFTMSTQTQFYLVSSSFTLPNLYLR